MTDERQKINDAREPYEAALKTSSKNTGILQARFNGLLTRITQLELSLKNKDAELKTQGQFLTIRRNTLETNLLNLNKSGKNRFLATQTHHDLNAVDKQLRIIAKATTRIPALWAELQGLLATDMTTTTNALTAVDTSIKEQKTILASIERPRGLFANNAFPQTDLWGQTTTFDDWLAAQTNARSPCSRKNAEIEALLADAATLLNNAAEHINRVENAFNELIRPIEP